jgi:hypothetical protein
MLRTAENVTRKPYILALGWILWVSLYSGRLNVVVPLLPNISVFLQVSREKRRHRSKSGGKAENRRSLHQESSAAMGGPPALSSPDCPPPYTGKKYRPIEMLHITSLFSASFSKKQQLNRSLWGFSSFFVCTVCLCLWKLNLWISVKS